LSEWLDFMLSEFYTINCTIIKKHLIHLYY
jgi:hypothetical protein